MLAGRVGGERTAVLGASDVDWRPEIEFGLAGNVQRDENSNGSQGAMVDRVEKRPIKLIRSSPYLLGEDLMSSSKPTHYG